MTNSKPTVIMLDILERSFVTGGEQFLAVCLAAGGVISLVGLPWAAALATAAGAFLVAFLTGVMRWMLGIHPTRYWLEVVQRVVLTFIQSILAAMGAGVVDVIHFHWVSALNVAALAAFFALAKCVLAPNAFDNFSPSLLRRDNVTTLEGSHK